MLKWLDIPPSWLIGCLVLAWIQSRYASLGLSLDSSATQLVAGLLIGAGALLIILAAVAFRRSRTTIIPHHTPSALVTTGIFSRSRNPIYLGDALILLGFVLRWDAVLCLPLVPLFMWLIERRFITAEESRMRRAFGPDWARYERTVRRWL